MGKLLGLVAVLVVVVAGVYLYSQQTKDALESGADSAIDAAQEAKGLVESKQPITSLRDAMGLGQKTTCTYSSDVNGEKYSSTVIVEGKRYQATTVAGGTTTYALNDGTTQYVWTEGQPQGFKMDLSCLEKMKDSLKDLPQGQQMPQDIESSFDAAGDVSCQPGGNVEITVPDNVTFTDQCALMEQSMQMMQQLPAGAGGGAMPGNPGAEPQY